MVFDASGLDKKTYKEVMDELGIEFAYGVTPCKRAGHTLRTRAGHCIQCDTAKIAYQLRYNESGIVYVAYSEKLSLTKVGVAKNVNERLKNLNSHGYGGTKDWKIYSRKECKMSGQIEMQIHKYLAVHQALRNYEKAGNIVECRELFHCRPDMAIEYLQKITSHLPEIQKQLNEKTSHEDFFRKKPNVSNTLANKPAYVTEPIKHIVIDIPTSKPEAKTEKISLNINTEVSKKQVSDCTMENSRSLKSLDRQLYVQQNESFNLGNNRVEGKQPFRWLTLIPTWLWIFFAIKFLIALAQAYKP